MGKLSDYWRKNANDDRIAYFVLRSGLIFDAKAQRRRVFSPLFSAKLLLVVDAPRYALRNTQ
jgi:hypothetical protein